MLATEKLEILFDEAIKEGNSINYISELVAQLELFGTQYNKLTTDFVLKKIEKAKSDIDKHIERR